MLDIFITLFLVFLNGFFVAAEFAIVRVRSSQIELIIKSGHPSALLSKHIVGHLDGYLAATQLGITLASLGLGWVGEPIVSKLILQLFHLSPVSISPQLAHDIALPIAFMMITILHIVFGELAPKSLAIQRPESTTLLIAYPLQFFYLVFKPFIWLLNGIATIVLKSCGISAVHGSGLHSSDELKFIVKQGKDSGMIEEVNYDIIKNAFDFSERTVRQIMVHRTQVVAIDVNQYNEAVLEKIIEEGYSRIPCYENKLDSILGVVFLKDLLMKIRKKEAIAIRELVRPILIVPENRRIGNLLKEFQRKHQQIAVVVNEHGGTQGIVTMEDMLEELVGEIQDEHDNEIPVVEQVAPAVYLITASANISTINKWLPHPIKSPKKHASLAGVIITQAGRIPNTAEKLTFSGYEATILKKIKNSIVLVQLRNLT